MSALSGDDVSLFRCPACRGELKDSGGRLACVQCAALYPVTNGVPVLLRRDNELFDVDAAAIPPERTPTDRSGLRRWLPSLTNNYRAAGNYARLRALLGGVNRPLILGIGGGEGGQGQQQLGLPLLTTDVILGAGTDAVADAHDLPFDDGTFDAVLLQAVLEHVLDPGRCVAEAHRVLKPGGLVYAETPFMQQVHMGRYDFTRFTALGHRRLFRMFSQVDAGPVAGPGSALAWSISYFFASFARNLRQRRLLHAAGRCLFFWLRFFDRPLSRNDASVDAAAGFFFLGRRAEEPMPDSELVASYRGGIPL